MGSRTRRILDVLDSLARSTSLADSPNTSTTNDMSSTRKWLHDISVGRSSGSGPPRTTLRTPSRLYSIISNIRDKPYWKRPTEMAAAAAAKKKEVSFEADTEPVENEDGTKKVNNSELPKTHQPVLKSYTGRNVAGSLKSNTFNANIVDLEADVSSETTKKALESVKLPTELGKNVESGFLTKSRVFNFAKPVIRGPQAVLEKSFEKEESSSDESSMDDDDDEESDKEIEIISAKAINSDTSTSSPENSKIQKASSPSTKQQTPIPISSAAGDSWECSTCMVMNTASSDKCVCCETPKGGTANNAAPTAFKATEFKPAESSNLFGFKPSAPSLFSATPAPSFSAAPAFGQQITSAKTINSDTSITSPDNSKIQKDSSPSTKQQTPIPGTTAGDSWECSSCMVINTASSDKCVCCETPKGGSANNAAPTAFKATEFKPAESSNLFGFKPSAPSLFSATPAPSFSATPALGQQNNSFMPKTVDGNSSAPQAFSKPTSSTPFSFNAAAPNFNFGGNQQPATNGNIFNLPTNGVTQANSAPAPAFPSLGQQNNSFMPKTVDGNGSAPQDFSKPASSTPFSFTAAAPNFDFGGSQQPATNGTFQFSSSNSTSNLFNLPINGVTPAFSAPAPTFPTLGQQNTFMPVTGGSNSSNSRKLLLAKRKKR